MLIFISCTKEPKVDPGANCKKVTYNPKFHHGVRVLINYGFYKGKMGYINNKHAFQFKYPCYVAGYEIKLFDKKVDDDVRVVAHESKLKWSKKGYYVAN